MGGWFVAVTTLAVTLVAGPAGGRQTVAPAATGQVLLERTRALVGGAVITQSDIDLATALGLVDPAPGGDVLATLIERGLMLHEVARFSPPEPEASAVRVRLDAARARVGSPAALRSQLARAGATEARLEAWVRDDLRIAAYVDQRFASAGAPSDADVDAYVRQHAQDLASESVSPQAAREVARARLVQDRRRALVTDWVADLRRRTEVLEFKE
jgi:hypothetical protein